MNKESSEKALLESILVTQIILLSRDMDRADRAKGTIKIGDDYIHDAVTLIRRQRPKVLEALAAAR